MWFRRNYRVSSILNRLVRIFPQSAAVVPQRIQPLFCLDNQPMILQENRADRTNKGETDMVLDLSDP